MLAWATVYRLWAMAPMYHSMMMSRMMDILKEKPSCQAQKKELRANFTSLLQCLKQTSYLKAFYPHQLCHILELNAKLGYHPDGSSLVMWVAEAKPKLTMFSPQGFHHLYG